MCECANEEFFESDWRIWIKHRCVAHLYFLFIDQQSSARWSEWHNERWV